MSTPISLKDIERKTFRTVFEDGLWDILIGCGVLMFSLAPLLSESMGDFWSSFVFLPFWLLVYLGIRWIRKNVVIPRTGQVQFGKFRKLRLTRFSVTMVVINLVLLAAGIWVAGQGNALQWSPSLFLGIVALLGFSFAAYMLDFTRLYVYGLLIALSPWIGEYLYLNHQFSHHGFPVTFGITAGIIILAGMVIFARFVRNHPLPEME